MNFLTRPEDAFRRPIQSQGVTTENVLLQVTIPKRTGRKRKRGSNESFAWHADRPEAEGVAFATSPEAQLRSLQDNADNFTVKALGVVEETHRFRSRSSFGCQVEFDSKPIHRFAGLSMVTRDKCVGNKSEKLSFEARV